jgi:2'-5' RNA ligase
VRAVSAFDAVLDRVRWFAGDRVAWLAPEPSDPFRPLTQAVWSRFPDCPPYGGIHDDIIPHLTIGQNGRPEDMRFAAQVVELSLPVRIRVDRVALIQGSDDPGSWHTVTELPLTGS